jgi:hypothetical protein
MSCIADNESARAPPPLLRLLQPTKQPKKNARTTQTTQKERTHNPNNPKRTHAHGLLPAAADMCSGSGGELQQQQQHQRHWLTVQQH